MPFWGNSELYIIRTHVTTIQGNSLKDQLLETLCENQYFSYNAKTELPYKGTYQPWSENQLKCHRFQDHIYPMRPLQHPVQVLCIHVVDLRLMCGIKFLDLAFLRPDCVYILSDRDLVIK